MNKYNLQIQYVYKIILPLNASLPNTFIMVYEKMLNTRTIGNIFKTLFEKNIKVLSGDYFFKLRLSRAWRSKK